MYSLRVIPMGATPYVAMATMKTTIWMMVTHHVKNGRLENGEVQQNLYVRTFPTCPSC